MGLARDRACATINRVVLVPFAEGVWVRAIQEAKIAEWRGQHIIYPEITKYAVVALTGLFVGE